MTEYGLIGYPLVHSFSKQYFTEKFEREGTDARYINFEIADVGELRDIIESRPNLRGLNVTIPYKQQVLPLLSEVSADASEIGAVNCIVIERKADGRVEAMKGYNTDVVGFMRSIKPHLHSWHKRALVLGTGGASKAVVCGLRRLGLRSVLVSRTPQDGVLGYSELSDDVMREYSVIVNCTPVGTFPQTDACPDIPYKYIDSNHLLYDLVYNPAKTLFLQKGEAQGAAVKNGLEMLHLQAEAGWEIWNNIERRA